MAPKHIDHEYKVIAEKYPYPIRMLDVGEKVKLGDLFLTTDADLMEIDPKSGKIFGLLVAGQEVKEPGYWFRADIEEPTKA